MSFPDLSKFPVAHPGPYERQMGRCIVELLQLFQSRMPDLESSQAILELAMAPERWTAAHKYFDIIRSRYLAASAPVHRKRAAQYCFEESCLTALYNSTGPSDPFDSSSSFFVAPMAIALARVVGLPIEEVAAKLAPVAK